MPEQTVLIVVENSSPPLDIRVWYEATTLRDAGWRVTVICPTAGTAPSDHDQQRKFGMTEDLEGITLVRFPLTFAQRDSWSYLLEYLVAFLSIARLSWRVWRKDHFAVIHFCNPPDIFFPIGLFYRLLGAKMVFDHHDTFPEIVLTRFKGASGRLFYWFARAMEYCTFKCANAIISSNSLYREIAIKRGRVRPERVFVVRNGPRLGEFVPVEPDQALKQGHPYMACYVGVMGPQSGVLDLVGAIRHIVHDLDRRDVLFCLLGDGAIWPQVHAAVEEWKLESSVFLPGMIRDTRLLRQYICTADIGLSPLPLNPHNLRATPIKLGEYMAMGKPIVAFDLAESRNTAQDAAVYVPPGDIEGFGHAIVALLDNPERRQQMGKYGQQRVLTQLAWEHQQQHLLRAYALLEDTEPTS